MEENIYDFLGLTPKDGEAKVKEELEVQIKKWTNQLTRQAARAKAKLEVLKRFKAELGTNPNMLKEHADKYNALIAQKKQQQEKSIRDDAFFYVVNGEIEESALAELAKKNSAFSKEEILSIIGATIKKKKGFNKETGSGRELDPTLFNGTRCAISKPTKVFGIDFGTTYSCIAFVDEFGKPITVTNAENNSPVTPSVVFFETENDAIVGDIAKQALWCDPDLVCSTIKRQMGNPKFKFSANGVDYKPEEVSSLILKKLAMDASEKLGEEVKDVVITYPVYFGVDEKHAIKIAAEIAGLNVIKAIPEPIAAAYSYGLLNVTEPQTALIYDLGGVSFDVTVVRIANGQIEIVATCGDHYLGGEDWDVEIQKYAIDQYVQQTGGSADDIYDDTLALGDLKLKSEQAKKRLSQLEKTSFRLNEAKIEISRDQFENNTDGLLQRTIILTNQAIEDAAAKRVTYLDKILLVGGSTFMPQIKKRLEQEFPNSVIEFCDPNEAIAKGAALYGVQMSHSNDSGDDFVVPPVPVLCKGIALSLLHEKNCCILHNVFKKNMPLPCAKLIHSKAICEGQSSICFGIYDYYNEICIDVIKDIHFITDIHFLASKTIYFSKPLPINSPIDILIQVNDEGLLTNINIIDILNDDVIIVKL